MDKELHDSTHTHTPTSGASGATTTLSHEWKGTRKEGFVALSYKTRIILQVTKIIRDRQWWGDIWQHGRSTNWQHRTITMPG
jgi:hypothetical protein